MYVLVAQWSPKAVVSTALAAEVTDHGAAGFEQERRAYDLGSCFVAVEKPKERKQSGFLVVIIVKLLHANCSGLKPGLRNEECYPPAATSQ